jgi:hypothetical protein
MNTSHIYIAISILALIIVALIFFISGKSQKMKRLSPVASLAFGFILAGIVFGDNRLIGYSLMGIGLILSLMDMFRKARSR